ncbi:MAG: hypothetical protein V2J16_10760 [Thermoleophilia bacterium]|jgi:hypothetical protein|nr:hypothetical protein [Thermoleophilia bacterium]
MSVYIAHQGSLLGISTQDDATPEQYCCGDCRRCLADGSSHCPATMRRLELVADEWMLTEMAKRWC